MFSFQPNEFWLLSLHTARRFIWHRWCILPSLQAALNLLAKQLAKTTRSRELSPIKQRRELNADLPKFCWLLICCMKASPSCQWVCRGKAATTTFSGAHGNQEAHFVHGLTIVVTWGSFGNSGSRKPPLETLHTLGHESGTSESKWANGKVMLKIQNVLECSLRQSSTFQDWRFEIMGQRPVWISFLGLRSSESCVRCLTQCLTGKNESQSEQNYSHWTFLYTKSQM